MRKIIRAITANIHWLVFATLLALMSLLIVMQGRALTELRTHTNHLNQIVSQVKDNSERQHDTLFNQIECLAQVSIIAARGNVVTVQSLERCEYSSTATKNEPQIIIQREVIREATPAPEPKCRPKPLC